MAGTRWPHAAAAGQLLPASACQVDVRVECPTLGTHRWPAGPLAPRQQPSWPHSCPTGPTRQPCRSQLAPPAHLANPAGSTSPCPMLATPHTHTQFWWPCQPLPDSSGPTQTHLGADGSPGKGALPTQGILAQRCPPLTRCAYGHGSPPRGGGGGPSHITLPHR